jgi:glutamine cyclotransferase
MTDGWGLTVASNGDLIGTDSTDVLYTLRWDPANSSMQELRRVQITDTVLSAKTGAARARPVKWLNEIEWVEPGACAVSCQGAY